MTYTPTLRPDGTPDYERMLAQAALQLHPIGNALNQAASHLAYMRDLLPKTGDLTDEYRELVNTLAYLEQAYLRADQTLTDMALSAYITQPTA